MFVPINNFVATKVYKHSFLATKDVFCRDKHMFVATKIIRVAAPAHDNGGVGQYDVGLFHVTGNACCFSQGMYDRIIL